MKVSYVIPAHNAAAWLHPAVNSVFAQTYKDIELVIVNDGSTDSTTKYLDWLHKEYPKTVIVHIPHNGGVSPARNLGIEAASGEIIFALDADDLALPDRTKLAVARFKKGARFVYGMAEVIDAVCRKSSGAIGGDAFDLEKAITPTFQTLADGREAEFQPTNGIVHSTVAFTRELGLKYPYIKEAGDLGLDDWTQQIRMATDGVKFDLVPSVICRYRHLSSAISKTRDNAPVFEYKKRFLAGLKVKA